MSTTRRLTFPAKCYGRNAERAQLRSLYGNVADPQIVLVQGSSGTGKSNLVANFKDTVEGKAYFISGKCDEKAQADPFSVVIQAITQLCDQIIVRGGSELTDLRKSIVNGVGDEIALLVDMIPALEDVVEGNYVKQPDAFSCSASLNRVRFIFQRLIESACTQERPIILFLDDLQWINFASVDLLTMLLTDVNLKHFMFIGAYRDDELDEAHPLNYMMLTLRNQKTAVTDIKLGNLSFASLNMFVADVLHFEDDEVESLTRVLFKKTLGNMFFVKTSLASLADKSIITYSYVKYKWLWDQERVEREMQLSENVVSIVLSRIKTLQPKLQDILIIAARLPHTFDLNTLRLVLAEKGMVFEKEELRQLLLAIVSQGSLENSGNSSIYWFAHDRIKEAAMLLVSKEEQDCLNILVGKFLVKVNSRGNAEPWMIFAGVNCLNSVSREVTDVTTIEMTQLNYEAGRSASSSSAYATAVEYFDKAINLVEIQTNRWQNHYDLCHALYKKAAEAKFCTGDFDGGERLCVEALSFIKEAKDKIPIYAILSEGYGQQERHSDSIEVNKRILDILGEYPKGGENPIRVILNIANMKRKLSRMSDEELRHLKPTTDATKLDAMSALCRIVIRATFVDRKILLMQSALKIIRLSLKHGIAEPTIFAIMAFACWTYSEIGEYNFGRRMINLALLWLDTIESKEYAATIMFASIAYIHGWNEPGSVLMKRLNRSYEIGMRAGAVEFGLMSLAAHNTIAFISGVPLAILLDDYNHVMSTLSQYNMESVRALNAPIHELVLVLAGRVSNPLDWVRQIEMYTKISSVERSRHARLSWCYGMRLQAAYYFGDLKLAEEILACFRTFMGELFFWKVLINSFFGGLIAVARYRQTKKRFYKRLARSSLVQLRNMVIKRGPNHVHKYNILEAEYDCTFASKKHSHDIKRKFEGAITSSMRSGNMHDGALASELAGEYFARSGDVFWAQFYFTKALDMYSEWGANGKAAQLLVNQSFYLRDNRNNDIISGPMGTSRKPRYDMIARSQKLMASCRLNDNDESKSFILSKSSDDATALSIGSTHTC